MTLAAGTTLGPYEVIAAIGAGGMGEVYRARDTKLKRDVALKVLPEAFVADPERLARFQREAEVLASLNHPNIAHIDGLEDSGDTTALVLELVEGPTLADRIAEGAIPLDEAMAIAKQIAEAVEAAHALGIIHRDLKPANIKITPEGVVKVLDFGLATAFTGGEGADSGLSQSPTLTKGTALGTILGTAAYMSPEQAKGKPVDTPPTCGRSVSCSMKCWRERERSRARTSPTHWYPCSETIPIGRRCRTRCRRELFRRCECACKKMRSSGCAISPRCVWRWKVLSRPPLLRQSKRRRRPKLRSGSDGLRWRLPALPCSSLEELASG